MSGEGIREGFNPRGDFPTTSGRISEEERAARRKAEADRLKELDEKDPAGFAAEIDVEPEPDSGDWNGGCNGGTEDFEAIPEASDE